MDEARKLRSIQERVCEASKAYWNKIILTVHKMIQKPFCTGHKTHNHIKCVAETEKVGMGEGGRGSEGVKGDDATKAMPRNQ